MLLPGSLHSQTATLEMPDRYILFFKAISKDGFFYFIVFILIKQITSFIDF
jgi:hypothetical protein